MVEHYTCLSYCIRSSASLKLVRCRRLTPSQTFRFLSISPLLRIDLYILTVLLEFDKDAIFDGLWHINVFWGERWISSDFIELIFCCPCIFHKNTNIFLIILKILWFTKSVIHTNNTELVEIFYSKYLNMWLWDH